MTIEVTCRGCGEVHVITDEGIDLDDPRSVLLVPLPQRIDEVVGHLRCFVCDQLLDLVIVLPRADRDVA